MNPRPRKRIDPNTWVLLKQIFLGVLALSTVALLITAVWYGTRVKSLTLKEIEVSGGETIPKDLVAENIRQTLEGNYLGLVPRSFAWFYPETEIVANIKNIDRIHNVELVRISGTALSVTFDEYAPLALWCNSVSNHECAFVDKYGFAFSKAPDLGGGFFIRFVRIGEEYKLKEYFLDEGEFNSLLNLADLLAEINWPISYIEVDKAGDAFLRLAGGGDLKVVISKPPAEVVDNLQAVLASEEFVHLAPGNFQYIDLRFGNKVFVNEEAILDKENTSTSTDDVEV